MFMQAPALSGNSHHQYMTVAELRYFAELIDIEERARRLVREPAEVEAQLSALPGSSWQCVV